MPKLGFSIPHAVKQFEPPLSERALRRAVRLGTVKTIVVGKRKYITATELLRAAEAGEI